MNFNMTLAQVSSSAKRTQLHAMLSKCRTSLQNLSYTLRKRIYL